MRILITGNMGYVGPMLVRHLREVMPTAYLAGYDAGFFAHCLTTTAEIPEILLDVQRFGDVRNVSAGDLEGFDAVVHLAAVSNDPMGNRFESVTDAINHRASVAIAAAAAAAGVKKLRVCLKLQRLWLRCRREGARRERCTEPFDRLCALEDRHRGVAEAD